MIRVPILIILITTFTNLAVAKSIDSTCLRLNSQTLGEDTFSNFFSNEDKLKDGSISDDMHLYSFTTCSSLSTGSILGIQFKLFDSDLY